jgi:hypothetical protein
MGDYGDYLSVRSESHSTNGRETQDEFLEFPHTLTPAIYNNTRILTASKIKYKAFFLILFLTSVLLTIDALRLVAPFIIL